MAPAADALQDSQLQPGQQPPVPQGAPGGFWLLGSLGVGGHQLSGWPGDWHAALASTGFAEGWRVPAPLPRAWAQWGSGQDWGMKGAGHWPGRPSGSDLRNSRPRWPCKAILNCCNYRVSPGQWHHGVWASLTPPGATLGLGGGRSAGWGWVTSTDQGRSPEGRKWWGEEPLMVSADSLVQAGPVPSLCWGARREGGVWPGEAWGMRYQCSIRAGGGAAGHEAKRPGSPESSHGGRGSC